MFLSYIVLGYIHTHIYMCVFVTVCVCKGSDMFRRGVFVKALSLKRH